jgi:hypothetical protein
MITVGSIPTRKTNNIDKKPTMARISRVEEGLGTSRLTEEENAEVVLPDHIATLHNHDCLLTILAFLSWKDLNNFSLVSNNCHRVRSHASLDQTRSGTIYLGHGVSTAMEFLDKARTEGWSDAFGGNRTHLRLVNLTHLSSNIEPIDRAFLNTIVPLDQVQSLDCSMTPRRSPLCNSTNNSSDAKRATERRTPRTCRPTTPTSRSWFLAPFEDYVDKGFAQGVTLSMLVPNLKWIDMSSLPLTTVSIALLMKSNPNLEVIRWNRSLIWPISNESEGHLEACRCLKELYLDEARMIFCANLDGDRLWNALLNSSGRLVRVSLLGTTWYQEGRIAALSQEYLMEFVRRSPNIEWFRSDLSPENVRLLQKERPGISFVSSQ